MSRILVVDDDPRLREVVRYALSRAGFTVLEAGDGRQALDLLAREAVDLVVLDVLMPEMDGLSVCREVRRRSPVPIVFLSSRGEEFDRVLGLELGGDDYIPKPFSPRELVSRVRAVLRRARPSAQPEILAVGDVRLDPGEHRCWVGPAEVVLTVTEFRILRVLIARPGWAFSRAALLGQAYDGGHHVSERTLDSHVRRIRSKLREAGAGDVIETIHGLGYRLADAR